MKITYLPTETINPAVYNPRKISDEAFAGLKESLGKFGMPSPLVVNKRTGVLVSGHQRLAAAKALGWKEVPVVEVDLSIGEEKALNVTMNNRAITGEFTSALADVLADIRLELGEDFMQDIRLDDIEIPPDEYDENKSDSDSAADEAPAVPVVPKSKLGDLWTLGNHRLLCGDSTSVADVERLMDGAKADMVFTDPPYGVSYQSNMRTKSAKFDVIQNDDTVLTEWINLLPSVSSGWVFIWTTWKVLSLWLEHISTLGPMTNMIVWDKGGGGIGDLEKTFSTDYELALVFNRGAAITGKRLGSVWSIGKDRPGDYVHPTQKPVDLAMTAILNCVNHNARVLDLFGGSGSTLIACEKTKRRCFMMELDPKYVDVIVARWASYTGQDPVRADGVKWSDLQ